MDPTAPIASREELLLNLGSLTRGLSCLFWGLPLCLITSVQVAMTDWYRPLNHFAFAPPTFSALLIWHGFRELSQFRHSSGRDVSWRQSIERSEIFGLVGIGLSPFLYWWSRFPNVEFFLVGMALMGLNGMATLYQVNHNLRSIAERIPDESLREEVRFFSTLNTYLLWLGLAFIAAYSALIVGKALPNSMVGLLLTINMVREWLLLFFLLWPLSITMSMIWKAKRVNFILARSLAHRSYDPDPYPQGEVDSP
jgi:hypothetical protein